MPSATARLTMAAPSPPSAYSGCHIHMPLPAQTGGGGSGAAATAAAVVGGCVVVAGAVVAGAVVGGGAVADAADGPGAARWLARTAGWPPHAPMTAALRRNRGTRRGSARHQVRSIGVEGGVGDGPRG